MGSHVRISVPGTANADHDRATEAVAQAAQRVEQYYNTDPRELGMLADQYAQDPLLPGTMRREF